jgi:hypothetical protein
MPRDFFDFGKKEPVVVPPKVPGGGGGGGGSGEKFKPLPVADEEEN